MVICLERGADLHMAQLMPLPLTVSCFSKIQTGFTFLLLAHLGSPGKGPLNGCVCVCVCAFDGSWQWLCCYYQWCDISWTSWILSFQKPPAQPFVAVNLWMWQNCFLVFVSMSISLLVGTKHRKGTLTLVTFGYLYLSCNLKSTCALLKQTGNFPDC